MLLRIVLLLVFTTLFLPGCSRGYMNVQLPPGFKRIELDELLGSYSSYVEPDQQVEERVANWYGGIAVSPGLARMQDKTFREYHDALPEGVKAAFFFSEKARYLETFEFYANHPDSRGAQQILEGEMGTIDIDTGKHRNYPRMKSLGDIMWSKRVTVRGGTDGTLITIFCWTIEGMSQAAEQAVEDARSSTQK